MERLLPVRLEKEEPSILWQDRYVAVIAKGAHWVCAVSGTDSDQNRTLWRLRPTDVSAGDIARSGKHEHLAHWVMTKWKESKEFELATKPDYEFGIAHRLDCDTSGCLLIAKTATGFTHLKNLFNRRQVYKEYICLCHGLVNKTTDEVELPIAWDEDKNISYISKEKGQWAKSIYTVMGRYRLRGGLPGKSKFFTLCRVVIITGRTHQIRIHMTSIGHPLVSDSKYNYTLSKTDTMWCPRLFLHAWRVGFSDLNSEWQEVKAPLMADLSRALRMLDEVRIDPDSLKGNAPSMRLVQQTNGKHLHNQENVPPSSVNQAWKPGAFSQADVEAAIAASLASYESNRPKVVEAVVEAEVPCKEGSLRGVFQRVDPCRSEDFYSRCIALLASDSITGSADFLKVNFDSLAQINSYPDVECRTFLRSVAKRIRQELSGSSVPPPPPAKASSTCIQAPPAPPPPPPVRPAAAQARGMLQVNGRLLKEPDYAPPPPPPKARSADLGEAPRYAPPPPPPRVGPGSSDEAVPPPPSGRPPPAPPPKAPIGPVPAPPGTNMEVVCRSEAVPHVQKSGAKPEAKKAIEIDPAVQSALEEELCTVAMRLVLKAPKSEILLGQLGDKAEIVSILQKMRKKTKLSKLLKDRPQCFTLVEQKRSGEIVIGVSQAAYDSYRQEQANARDRRKWERGRDNVPEPEPDYEMLRQQLVEMGYNSGQALKALKANYGNIMEAMDMLANMPPPIQEQAPVGAADTDDFEAGEADESDEKLLEKALADSQREEEERRRRQAQDDEALEAALAQSLQETSGDGHVWETFDASDHEAWEAPRPDETEEEKQLREAIELSRREEDEKRRLEQREQEELEYAMQESARICQLFYNQGDEAFDDVLSFLDDKAVAGRGHSSSSGSNAVEDEELLKALQLSYIESAGSGFCDGDDEVMLFGDASGRSDFRSAVGPSDEPSSSSSSGYPRGAASSSGLAAAIFAAEAQSCVPETSASSSSSHSPQAAGVNSEDPQVAGSTQLLQDLEVDEKAFFVSEEDEEEGDPDNRTRGFGKWFSKTAEAELGEQQ